VVIPEVKMLNKLSLGVLGALMVTSRCNAIEVAGINMPDVLEMGQSKLILNGAGVRDKFFFKVYVGALYLEQKRSDPVKIIEANEPMAIRLHIIASKISSEVMAKTSKEGFKKAAGRDIVSIEAQIDRFLSVFKNRIRKHDIYDLIYVPGRGTEVYKNKEYRSLAKGLPFKKALFGIWLCDKPAQKKLKTKMLGK